MQQSITNSCVAISLPSSSSSTMSTNSSSTSDSFLSAAWGYGILATTIITLSALGGIMLLPCIHKVLRVVSGLENRAQFRHENSQYDCLRANEIVLWTSGLTLYDGHAHSPFDFYWSKKILIGSHFTSGHVPCSFGRIWSHIDMAYYETVCWVLEKKLRKICL